MKWRLFGDIGERVGTGELSLDVAEDATVADALEALLAAHPTLRERVLDGEGALAPDVTLLCDGEPLPAESHDQPVDSDAELALLPPVSGG